MKAARITNALLIAIAFVIIFIYGKPLIMPFVIAVIFWFLIKEIRDLLKKIPLIRKKVPAFVLNLIGFAIIFAVLGAITQILIVNIKQLTKLIPVYQENITAVAESIQTNFSIDIVSRTKEFLGDFEYSKLLSSLLTSLKDIFGKAFLIIIYTLFLLLEEPFFSRKIKAIYSNISSFSEVNSILGQIDKSIGRYLSIKTLVSIITASLSYFALLIIGIDVPLFWAFLIFIMNFIPTIGSLIATLFPAIFAMLQFGEYMPGIWVLSIVGAIQLVIGNFLDPKLTGDSLNVSPLVVILGLSFWGAIWGILGMILSVPISVMMIIIFAHIPGTRSIAILLSKKGNVGSKPIVK
ncbi:MAG: AI-2E family transporter [Salinivirgaceae bacterium]|jgi:AI-2 transport protein TqsA|nr:AI-2E family transporter [Salinivirgaceae bacterium]